MIEGKPYQIWPWPDDRAVVEEMLRDSQSEQWYECSEFVKKRVRIQAKNIFQDHWDDIAQEAMIRIYKSLHTFQHGCSLRTWLFGIVNSCVIDTYRKLKHAEQYSAPLGNSLEDAEQEGSAFTVNHLRTPEEEYLTRNELEKALELLHEYISLHAKPTRNRRILEMVLSEGHSLEETARVVGCSAAVAGYVVRSAQQFVRKMLGYQP